MTHSTPSRGKFPNYAFRLRSRTSAGRRRLPRLESLEDRTVPATFHVSLTGNDVTGDGSIASPFRTVQKGIDAAAAGLDLNDIVEVATGTYSAPGVDLGITIPASPALTNLQLLGGWDAAFTTQNSTATPTIYVFQNAASLSGDLSILNPNTTINGFTWVLDGQAGAGATRTDSGGLVVEAAGAVITNNHFEVSPRTAGPRPTAIQTSSTNLSGLSITGNTFTFDATTPNATTAAVGIFINPDAGLRLTPLVINGNTFTGDNLGSAIVIKTTSNVEFTNNSVTRTGSSNTFLSLVDLRQTTASQNAILIDSNNLINQSANAVGAGIFTNGDTFGSPTNTLSATFTHNNITGNRFGIAVDSLAGSTVVARFNALTSNTDGVTKVGATVVDFTANWWGSITGPTVASNLGGGGQTIAGAGADSVLYAPWLVYSPDSNPVLPGVQLPITVTVTAGNDVSPAENDFKLLQNAVGLVQSGQTLNLSGDFDWTAPFAAAAYVASVNTSASGDIRGVELPGGVDDVTITSSAANAHIHGRGDFSDAAVDAFLFADDGPSPGNTNFTLEKLNIDDFENAVTFGWNGTGTFNGTRIRNNTITIGGDSGDNTNSFANFQNVAIYFAEGTNQQITGNTVNFQADGTRTVGTGARSLGFQNNTTGGALYDGLLIDGNTFKLLASSGAEIVTGIWENGHNDDNSSNIAITNNQFLGRAGDLFDRGLMLTSQTTGLVIDANTFTDVDNVYFARNAAGGTDPGDHFTFTNNVLTRVGGVDGIFLQNVTNDPVPVHVVINWNINNTIDGETGVRGLNELSTQATHAARPNTAASDINAVVAIGAVTDTFVNDDWGTAGRFTDPDGIGTGFGPIAFGFNTFATIQQAVDATSPGGTVGVLAGTYGEFVTVNKTLTIHGAQAGVDARTGRPGAAESIVQQNLLNQAGFNLAANSIVLDGFVIQNSTNAIFPGFGIILGAGKSGSQVLNNIIQNNIAGISLANTGANQARIQFNLIRNNNQPGSVSGHGIYTDQFNAGGTLANVLIDSNSFVGNSGQGIGFSSDDPTKPAAAINISNNLFDGNGRGLYAFNLNSSSITGNTFRNSTDATTADLRLFEGDSGLTISGNVLQNGAGRALRISNLGTGAPNATNVTFTSNSVSGYTGPVGVFQLDAGQYTGPLHATGNWWGNITGPTIATNPGGTGQTLSDPDGVVDFQPWLVYAPDRNPVVPGVQFQTSFSVPAQTAGFTTTNNNYLRLVNVVDLLQEGQIVTLSGTFDWTESNAAADWALGNDGLPGTDDDFSLMVPADINEVTITAATLGSARIQGPGDLPQVDLEGTFFFNGGPNQDWTISNLEIFDFDMGIGMFQGAGGTDAFDNTKILNNHIRVPKDLNSTVAPNDAFQNIGIHFAFGSNQTIQGNQIDIAGDGVSAGASQSVSVGMQSNTSSLDVYDGLLIDSNIVRVIGAQSANPARILGIWENSGDENANITVSNNSFLNQSPGNNPALNLQRAFRVHTHSSATTTVTYSGNMAVGANIGFEWLPLVDLSGHEPVRLIGNTITNCDTGVLVQSGGSAYLAQNKITGSGTGGGVHVVVGSLAAATPGVNAVEENFITGGTGDGIRIDATGSITGGVFNNDLSGNFGFGLNNLSAGPMNASANWWGTASPTGVANEVGGTVDFTPWLDIGTDSNPAPGFQGDFGVLHVSAAGAQTPPVGRIQEGINLATSGGTVIVVAGTYGENLVIAKGLSVQGVGTVTLNAAGGVGINASAAGADVTVEDLTINGAATAVNASNLNSFTLSNVGVGGSTAGGTINNVPTVDVILDAGATNHVVTITATDFQVDGKTFTYSGVGTLNVTTGAGDDTFNVTSIGVTAISLDGGANTDVGDTLNTTAPILFTIDFVNIENFDGVPPVFVDGGNLFIQGTTGPDKINVTIRNATELVVKIGGTEVLAPPLVDITGRIFVRARDGNDQVTIASNVPIGADIRGGLGSDKLIGGQGNDLLDGGPGVDTMQGGRGSDILLATTDADVLAGQGDTDTLLGPPDSSTWLITGVGAGKINSQAQFNTVENLVGGADDDVFLFGVNGSVKGTIDGGAGVNKLDYSKISGLTVINLSIGTATRTGGVANIRDVDGGNGPSLIVGDSQDNVLLGNGGRDLLIGGGGVDFLAGGNGDDILIGGTTVYDASNTALKTLMNEWKGTAKYDVRVDRLMRIRAGGLNAGNSLTTQTVASDGVANVLDGQGGRDWFFVNPLDLNDATPPDERVVNL